MKYTFLMLILFFFTCKNTESKKENIKPNSIITADYELIQAPNSKTLLILFPGAGSKPSTIKRDFDIIDNAKVHGISVLLMDFSSKLWIDEYDTEALANKISAAIEDHNLTIEKTYMGGMSIGGTISLTLANYLKKKQTHFAPDGVFVIDSPIDLYALYQSSKKDVLRTDFSEERLAEPRWIIDYFEREFVPEDSLLTHVQKVSPITLSTKNYHNIRYLKDSKLRFYTEPDTLWYKEYRQTDFESTNAYTIQHTTKFLQNNTWQHVELIETRNKGFRSDGSRHPHSWSIVDKEDFIDWIME